MKAAKTKSTKHERSKCNTSPGGPLRVRPRCLKQGMTHGTWERPRWPDVPVSKGRTAFDACSQRSLLHAADNTTALFHLYSMSPCGKPFDGQLPINAVIGHWRLDSVENISNEVGSVKNVLS